MKCLIFVTKFMPLAVAAGEANNFHNDSGAHVIWCDILILEAFSILYTWKTSCLHTRYCKIVWKCPTLSKAWVRFPFQTPLFSFGSKIRSNFCGYFSFIARVTPDWARSLCVYKRVLHEPHRVQLLQITRPF